MAVIVDDSQQGNPFKGWDAVENVSRPTETEALRRLYRWWAVLQKSKLITLTPLHQQLLKLEIDCWKMNRHYSTSSPRDRELVYEYIGFHAGILTRDDRGMLVADTFAVENLLAEASVISYLQEYGVSEEVEFTRELRAA